MVILFYKAVAFEIHMEPTKTERALFLKKVKEISTLSKERRNLSINRIMVINQLGPASLLLLVYDLKPPFRLFSLGRSLDYICD